MSFLTKLLSSLLPTILNWMKDNVLLFIQYFVELSNVKDNSKARREQAKIVDDIAEQIKALMSAGEQVPQELKERLREESRKLHQLTVSN